MSDLTAAHAGPASPAGSPLRRVAITGSSGALGSMLIGMLRQRSPTTRIFGTDLREPRGPAPDEFLQADIRSPDVRERLVAFAPDTIIHAAFAFQPLRDDRAMRQTNVDGAAQVLAAAASVGPCRLLMVSSATAYGAWDDNPVPIEETWPLRPRPEFRYAADKTRVEELIATFAAAHPEIAVSILRPSLIGGPGIDNYVIRLLLRMPILALLDGVDTPLQFVHEDDVGAAIWAVLTSDGRGAYNVGPRDWLPFSDVAKVAGRSAWRMPFWLAYAACAVGWAVRLPWHEAPAPLLYFLRYPWVVAPTRLERELGFTFMYTSRETLQRTVDGWRERRRV